MAVIVLISIKEEVDDEHYDKNWIIVEVEMDREGCNFVCDYYYVNLIDMEMDVIVHVMVLVEVFKLWVAVIKVNHV